MRYFVFLSTLVIGAFLISGTSVQKSSSFNQASAIGGVPALFMESDEKEDKYSEDIKIEYFDKAFDLEEGRSVLFGDMSVIFLGITDSVDCGDASCRVAKLELSFAGQVKEVELVVGEIVDWNNYRVKVSQIAPHENPHEIPHRVILLVHGAK